MIDLKKNWLLHLCLLVYVVVIFLVISVHEQWADEAQAWLLARDSGPFELLFKNLHYEGHPPLWYIILMLPSRILPYRGLSIISALITIAGVFVLLYYSPFPKYVKVLIPFTYFIFYQYGVIARSYVLIPLLLFLIARIYKDKSSKAFQFAILNVLLANTSVFTMLVAVSIMFVNFIDLIKTRAALDRRLVVRQIMAYGIFIIAIGLIVIQLWQPEDSSFAKTYNFGLKHFIDVAPKAFSESMTENVYLAVIVLIFSLIWFWKSRKILLYVLSTLSVLALFSIKYYNSWHQGVIFLIWVFVMWVSFEQSDKIITRLFLWCRIGAKIVLLIVIGLQIYWSVTVSINDYKGAYSAGAAIAKYIKENNLEDKKICAISFWTTAVQAYFDKNIFINHNNGQKPSYWKWSTKSTRIDDLDAIIKEQPELIIIGRPAANLKEIPGYRFDGIFEGNLYWKTGIKEKNDFGIFRRMNLSSM